VAPGISAEVARNGWGLPRTNTGATLGVLANTASHWLGEAVGMSWMI
jgi:hypothetical protein